MGSSASSVTVREPAAEGEALKINVLEAENQRLQTEVGCAFLQTFKNLGMRLQEALAAATAA